MGDSGSLDVLTLKDTMFSMFSSRDSGFRTLFVAKEYSGSSDLKASQDSDEGPKTNRMQTEAIFMTCSMGFVLELLKTGHESTRQRWQDTLLSSFFEILSRFAKFCFKRTEKISNGVKHIDVSEDPTSSCPAA